RPRVAAVLRESVNQSVSGGGRRAGAERGMARAETDEFGVGCQVQVFDRSRQLQQRRRGEKEIIGQREDGADRAGVGGLLIGVVVRRLLRLSGVEVRRLRGEGGSDRKVG